MNKPTMNDLKKAILEVLENARKNYEKTGHTIVSWHELYTLQAEYNIYFVEPDEEQIDLI